MVGVAAGLILGLLLIATPFHGAVITINSPGASLFGRFGQSIDAADGLLAVGAPGASVSGVGAGQVWIFNDRSGSLLRTVISPNVERGGQFGFSVKLAGQFLIVGAPAESVNGRAAAGRVYIFSSKTGSLVKSLVSPNIEFDGFFGGRVAQENGLVYVGASIESVNGIHAAGRVYVFDVKTGNLVMTLFSPNIDRNSVFGIAVDVSKGRLIVGTEDTVNGFDRAGRAYVFNATSGSLISTLVTTNPQPGGLFGNSVAITDELAIVGAFDESVNGVNNAGRVYLYNATTGSLIMTLVSPDAQIEGSFGVAVKLVANRILVGAPNQIVGKVFGIGEVYVFGITTGVLIRTLVSPNPEFQAQFGISVDVANGRIFVGAPGATVGGQVEAGSAYIFRGTVHS
jgi:hypothetical protein